jgi:exosortase/archaeosortase family protein
VTATRRAVAVRLLALLGAVFVIFAGFQEPVRHVEAVITAGITTWISGASTFVVEGIIVVRPVDQAFFVALLTPSCSVLASSVSLALLGSVASAGDRKRRAVAVGASVTVVVIGNFVRLSGSLIAGVAGGSGSLVLFHDTVGSVLTYGYILGGYVLMLWILLPAERRDPLETSDKATVTRVAA